MDISLFIWGFGFSIILFVGDGFRQDYEFTRINATSDEFLTIQVHAIEEYKKSKPNKKWSCSYKDHLKAFSYIPLATISQQIYFSELMEKALNGTGMKIIRGASSVADLQREQIDTILVWEGIFVNTLQYYNVLYGGNKYFHIGIGLPFPDSYYSYGSETLRFYDLRSCVPFTEYVTNRMEDRVKEILIMPKESFTKIRNEVNGIAALLHETINAGELFSTFLNPAPTDAASVTTMSSMSNVTLDED